MIAYVNVNVLIALLYQGLVIASFGFVAWNNMLQKYRAVSLHSFLFIMPVSGVLLGGLVLEEPITFNILLALVLIVSGIVVVNLKGQKIRTLISSKRCLDRANEFGVKPAIRTADKPARQKASKPRA